jgi:hypothetical protein
MPKIGATVGTPEGDGVVVSNDMLKLITKVKISKGDTETYKDFPTDRLDMKKNKFNQKNQKDDDDEVISEDMKKLLD